MIIQTLTLQHFRQYYGTQSITFSQGENEELVTVILGENGRGKTGIYRAVIFGLFGEMRLEQDSDDSDLILTNTKALQEDYQSEKKGVEASITIEFNHENEDYLMERVLYSIQEDNGEIIERVQRVKLLNKTTGYVIEDETEISLWMDNILDSRVKNYFFFDGERIERLTRATVEQRNEISTGIKNLLKIDHLLKAKEVLVLLQKQVTKELQKTSTGDYQKKLQEKVNFDDSIEKIRWNKEKIRKFISQNEYEINEIDRKLESFKGKLSDIDKRRQLEDQLNREEQEAEHAFQRLQEFNSFLPFMLAKDTLYAVKAQVEMIIGDKLDEANASLDLLDKLLHDLTCICGTAFTEGSAEYKSLESLRKVAGYQTEKADYFELKASIMKLIGILDDKEAQLQYLIHQYEREQQEVEDVKVKLDRLNNRLKETKIEDLDQLNQKRQSLIESRTKANMELQTNEDEMEELQSKRSQVELILRDLKAKSGVHLQLVEKQEALDKSIAVLDELIKEFEQEVTSELEILSTQNLSYLLDESGQMNIKKVKVQGDYSLEVLNTYDHPFLANISQGQRQVLSLSFITALAQVAGGDQVLEMPLFMDTPFGRLSGKHQHNLLSFIPNVCSQWILLVTDREFGREEQSLFEEQRQLGKYYKLVSTEPGVTQIVEQQLVGGV
ncbi:DNA sulfur modification protein DndD [Gracilibacillus sp. S3-1-1]|uniref:DNA sulfur modification protein DndD n=1 Tax=Gracilibacillus pellucidus TaxID=3095368 RepID=A0ACC6M8H5_9BACI|nr:DNA sulfur modification protein DndD [Gracilibacillus sp. S3-1-1]MDX8047293.1 DNA sulfur modification protein DndD [Gracilibacillus sp. S3-1-1]